MVHHIFIFILLTTKVKEIKRQNSSNREIGQIGERLAEKHLISAGYTILEKNWRFKKAEIDIIAKIENILVFVEVKARSNNYFGQPEAFVTAEKEALIQDAAQRYMEEIDHNWEIRFDIIAVLFGKEGQNPQIEHFKDAFFS